MLAYGVALSHNILLVSFEEGERFMGNAGRASHLEWFRLNHLSSSVSIVSVGNVRTFHHWSPLPCDRLWLLRTAFVMSGVLSFDWTPHFRFLVVPVGRSNFEHNGCVSGVSRNFSPGAVTRGCVDV